VSAANKLEDVYGEIFKVLKPGGLFLSYEWVSTKLYDPNNAGTRADIHTHLQQDPNMALHACAGTPREGL